MRTAPLSSVCAVNPRLDKAGRPNAETEVTFVPMASVDETFGEIAAPQVRPYSEVMKGFTPFRENDVLFAKITPCMQNGKAAIARNLRNGIGFGSTEFHVLRAGPEVLPEWIFHYIRQPDFRRRAKATFRGAVGQQRVPADFLEREVIAVPPVDEQRRIVDILSRAEGIIRLQRQAADKAREIIPALFLDMFGDPATNPKGWTMKTFGSVGTLDRGKSRHRPRDAKELYGGPYPFIQTGDIANSRGRITNFTTTYSEVGLAQSRLWPKGTLCITIAANIAKTGILEFDACFPDSVVGFLPDNGIRTEYVQAWLSFLQPNLEAIAPQAAQKNINLEILRKLPIPVPPLRLQQEFADRVNDIRGILLQRDVSQRSGDSLFQSLLSQAFSG